MHDEYNDPALSEAQELKAVMVRENEEAAAVAGV